MGKENVAMGAKALSTGDKILHLMKDSRIGISDLAGFSGIYEGVILEILADVCEADIDTLCRLADALGVEVYELRPDEERYAVMVEKNTLAKLIVISELKGVELGALVDSVLEQGIKDNGFYE